MKAIYRTAAFILLAWLIGIVGFHAYATWWNPPSPARNTERWLQHVRKQNYEEAAKLLKHADTIVNWSDDMGKLQDGMKFRLRSFARIEYIFDDGSFGTGQADLIFDWDGQAIAAKAILTTAEDGSVGQVCAITPPEADKGARSAFAEWNRLACGGSF